MRHGDRRLHEPAAERVMDRARADADERGPRAAEPGREAPAEEGERHAQRARLEVVENAGPGDDQQVEATGMPDGADQTGQLARPAAGQPIKDAKQNIGGPRQSDRQCRNAEIACDLIGSAVAVGAKADQFRFGPHPPQKGEHRLERAVVASIAAAEQAQQADPPWPPACPGQGAAARGRRMIAGRGGRSRQHARWAYPAEVVWVIGYCLQLLC